MASITAATAALIAAGASLAGAGVSAYASYQSGQSQKEAAEYNAKVAEAQAHDSIQRGADEAGDIRARARKVASAQAEGAAMSGVEINSGTPLALLTETAGLGELDALRTLNNAQRQAWGYSAQADLDRYQGKAAARAGMLSAGASILTGAGNAYFGYRGAVGGKG